MCPRVGRWREKQTIPARVPVLCPRRKNTSRNYRRYPCPYDDAAMPGHFAFFPHRAWAARRADAFRCAGLSRALRVAAPLIPPRLPMARIICERTAGLFRSTGGAVACATMDAANWLMS